MKRIVLSLLIFTTILFVLSSANSIPQNNKLNLIEEDRSFWNEFLNDNTIQNKNILYASYIAYKDKLNDLSIETFRECINTNSGNSIVIGISNYYIGKNLFLIGKYREAITQFINVKSIDLAKFNDIKYAAMINTAISYHRLNETEKFREHLQNVISEDMKGKYKQIALDILAKTQ